MAEIERNLLSLRTSCFLALDDGWLACNTHSEKGREGGFIGELFIMSAVRALGMSY